MNVLIIGFGAAGKFYFDLLKKDIKIKKIYITDNIRLPLNKKYTGPLSSFINLLKSENYKMLLNHLESEIIKVFESNNRYGFEVRILGGDKIIINFNGLWKSTMRGDL